MPRLAPLPTVLLLCAVVGCALLPRVGPALAGYHPSPDAAEYLLLARSLARGEGYVLPVRVRLIEEHADEPVAHPAHAERAPLWPLGLAPLVALLGPEPGWPDPRLQLLGVALAALAAAQAAELTLTLARQRRLGPRSAGWAALLAGLAVAWQPSLVRASIHLWAEPLGLVLGLLCLRGALGLRGRPTCRVAWTALVLGAGLARYARPEAWVLLPLALVAAPAGRRLAAALALGALTGAGIAWTGALAPQLFLLRVDHYAQATHVATAPTAADALTGALGNLLDQLRHLALPKNAWLVLPLALVGARWRGARLLLGWALLNTLATCAVWSTRDPHRFTLATFVALAPVAAVEAEALRKRYASGERTVFAAWVGVWVLVFGHSAGRELRGAPPPPAPAVPALQDAPPALPDPWSYALETGGPAVLAREQTE
ncbi:MAG: hypothetical protein R3F62_08290 [Planctomycetota bacterium]